MSRVIACLALVALAVLSVVPNTAAQDKVIKVGAPLPATGPLSPEGEKLKRGYDLWAETANKAGGVKVGADRYRVQMVYYDYQSNTPRAVQLTEKLVTDDRVNFLFSPLGSGATKAASGVSEKYGIPTIAPTASSEEVYDQGYKYLFGVYTPNKTLTEPLADIVKERVQGAKKVAILARNDLFPLAIAQEMERSAKKRGFEIVFNEKYAIGTMDHASALTQIRAAQPHWVFVTGYTNDMILVRKQMGDMGLTAPVVTMIVGPAFKEFVDANGPRAENVTSAAWWHPVVRYKGEDVFGTTENYNRLVRERYSIVPDYGDASASVSGALLQLAIERAGTIDPKKVRDVLAGLNVTTFYGPVRFAPNGQNVGLDPPVFQIQDGKQVVVYPAAVKQADFKIGVK
jgi:branched-chain amino acid transport system substrate-binding protein